MHYWLSGPKKQQQINVYRNLIQGVVQILFQNESQTWHLYTHGSSFRVMKYIRIKELWNPPLWPGMWQRHPCMKALRGPWIQLWKGNLNYTGDPRITGNVRAMGIWQGALHTESGNSLRKKKCVAKDSWIELVGPHELKTDSLRACRRPS